MSEKIGLEAVLDNRDFNRAVKQYLSGIDRMEGKTGRASGVLSKALGGIGKVAAGALAVGVAAGAAAVGAIGLAIVKAIPLAADFQTQLVGLQIAAKQSGMSFDELHDLALAVGGDVRLLGVSATGAADAMTGLYKAGLTTTEIFGDVNAFMEEGAELGGALRASIDLAAATELDMVQASELAAVALATFGGELETEAERAEFVATAMDNLVRAADASVAEVGDLAAALSLVGPGAVAVGLSIEEVNNALAILSTAGIKGTRAGTALDGMLRSLQAPGQEAAETIADLGIELYKVDGTFRELPDIIGQFSEALAVGGQTTQQVSAISAGHRKELTKLQKQRTEAVQKLEEYNLGLRGTTQTEKARTNSVARLQEQIGILDSRMVPLIAESQKYITVTREMTEEQRNQALGAIFTAQGQRAMNTLLDKGVEGWEAMGEATAAAAGIQEQAAARAKTFAGRMEALQGTVETLKIGIGEAFLPVLTELTGQFSEMVSVHGPRLTEMFGNLGEWLGENLPRMIEKAVQVGGLLVKWMREDLTRSINIITSFWNEKLKPFLDGLRAGIGDAQRDWSAAWVKIEEIVRSVVERVGPFVKEIGADAIAFIRDVMGMVTQWLDENRGDIEATLQSIKQIWEAVWPHLERVLRSVWETIKIAVRTSIAIIQGVIEAVMAVIRGDWDKAWEAIKGVFTTVWDAMRAILEAKINLILGFLGTDLGGVGAVISRWAEDTWATIKTWAVNVVATIRQFAEDAVSTVEGYAGQFVAAGRALIQGLIDGAKAKAQSLINAVKGVIGGAIGAAKRLLGIGSASKVFMEIGRNIAEGLIAGILESAADVQEALTGLFDVGAALRGLGAAAAQRMRERIIDPLEARVEELDKMLEETPIEERNFAEWIGWLQERLSLTEEIAENEARMAALRVQEQDLSFLQQQASLLELIREYGLDAADILGGMTLGVEANVADVVDAMTRAMQEVVKAAQAELGISSPSKVVAAKVGAPIMQGVVLGIEQYGGVLAEAFSRALVGAPAWGGPMVGAPAMIPAAAGASVQVQMDTTINDRMDAAVFEARVRQIITSSV